MENALSPKTLAIYQKAIQDICRAFNATSFDILKEHARVIAWIESLNKSRNTKKIYYISLVSSLKRMNDASFAAALKAYKEKQDSYNTAVREEMERQEKSIREEENFIEWPDVLKVREAARVAANDINSFQDYVLICLYTMLPPVRLDYSPMAVVQEESANLRGNYLLVRPSGFTIVLAEYKTAKRYGTKRIAVPKDLEKVLTEWLQLNPSGWLLCNAKGDPLTEKNLGLRITSIFQKYSGKSVGASMLRHSFVSWLRRNERPFLRHKEVADVMGHSVEMNALYRRL